jgi:hypothetical protein
MKDKKLREALQNCGAIEIGKSTGTVYTKFHVSTKSNDRIDALLKYLGLEEVHVEPKDGFMKIQKIGKVKNECR